MIEAFPFSFILLHHPVLVNVVNSQDYGFGISDGKDGLGLSLGTHSVQQVFV
jgi:hypothetical protein